MRERVPQPSGFDPHDRVVLRIEACRAPECLDRDGIGLDLAALASQCGIDDEAQEAGEPERVTKVGAGNNLGEFLADFIGAGWALGKTTNVCSYFGYLSQAMDLITATQVREIATQADKDALVHELANRLKGAHV